MSSPEFDPSKAIRMPGERDRSAEFKAARETLVTDINAWLGGLRQKQIDGATISSANVHWLLQPSSRVVETLLGRIAHNRQSKVRETAFGLSLTGDGVARRLEFQAVRPSTTGTEIVIVKGSDPLERAVDEGTNTGSQTDIVTKLIIEDKAEDGTQYAEFAVMADGSFHRSYLSPDGVHTGTSVTSTADIAMAQAAFDQVRASIG